MDKLPEYPKILYARYLELVAQGKKNSFEAKEIIKVVEAELYFGTTTIH